MSYLTKGLLGIGIAFTSLSMVTGCSMIQGTVNGTEKMVSSDVHAVDKALTPAKATPKKKVVHHKKSSHAPVQAAAKAKAPAQTSGNDATDVTLGS